MDNLPQIRMLNDPESTEMWIAGAIRDYSRLGADIGENTHVETLRVNTNAILNRAADNGFLDGIKRNTSIRNLSMMTVNNIYQVGGVAHEVLNVYKENNRLARLVISWCSLQNGTDNVITETLRGCSNLTKFSLTRSSLSDAQLLPMIKVLRGIIYWRNFYWAIIGLEMVDAMHLLHCLKTQIAIYSYSTLVIIPLDAKVWSQLPML